MADLRAAKTGAALRKAICEDREFEAHDLAIVEIAVASFDLARRAAAEIRKRGLLIEGPRGMKKNPACEIQQSAEARLLRCFKALHL